MGGTAAARAIHAALPNVRIVLHTLHKSAALIRTGLTAGATGYVVKTDPGNEMLATLEAVMRGEVYVTPSFGPELIAAIAKKISEKKRAAPESAIPDS
jgi:DNA-binding NarL/FixJ family response regulator